MEEIPFGKKKERKKVGIFTYLTYWKIGPENAMLVYTGRKLI